MHKEFPVFLLGLVLLCLFPTVGKTQLFVSSNFGHEEYFYDPMTFQQVDTGAFVSVSSGGLMNPHGSIVREDLLHIASFGTHDIKSYDRFTGAYRGDLVTNTAGLNQPVVLLYGPLDGHLYVSSQGNDQVRRYDPDTGTNIDASAWINAGLLDGPSGFDWSIDQERVYVAGRYSANVLAYDAATGTPVTNLHTLASGLGAGTTFGLAVDKVTGDVFVATSGDVQRYETNGTLLATIPIPGLAIGVQTSPFDSNLYVAANNNLYRIDPADNSVSGALLSGSPLNTHNFFSFTPNDDPFVGPLEEAAWSDGTQNYYEVSGTVAAYGYDQSVMVQFSDDLLAWSNAVSYHLDGTNFVRRDRALSVQQAFTHAGKYAEISERLVMPLEETSNLFFRASTVSDHEKVGWQAEFITRFHGVSGYATITDNETVTITNFYYDGTGIDARMVVSANAGFSPYTIISDDLLLPGGYSNATLEFGFPESVNLDDVNYISLWCVPAGVSFGDGGFL